MSDITTTFEKFKYMSAMAIGQAIHEEMSRRRMSVAELSNKAEVNKVVIYKILRMETYNIRSLLKVLETLDLTIAIVPK